MARNAFIIGLHRSTTTLMAKVLNTHTKISTLYNPESKWPHEGIYKTSLYGMPKQANGRNDGLFAFNLENHWNERHPLCNATTRDQLLSEWGMFWDHDADVWLEKSPPHLTRVGFFEGLFPGSKYINVIRHPLVVGIAAMQWTKKPGDPDLQQRVRHSAYCLKIAKEQLERYAKGRYIRLRHEELCKHTEAVLGEVQDFLGVEREALAPADGTPTPYRNFKYFQEYKQGLYPVDDSVITEFEATLNAFGYSFYEPYVLHTPYPGLTYLSPSDPEVQS